ncbi:hypothetical protein ElyMa_000275700 [Elysia marginata]|uniref:G-protein coupled receptors family 1 profile domain-containing protein n=1 Tax=Elysia marginata TaxID=1093978 RepID=A0AAV4F4R3_9GAST|nr:hypothetical protein ElyMa_000275700 [Elysia marginata]
MENVTQAFTPHLITASFETFLAPRRRTIISVIGFDLLTCTLGTFLNVWVAASILTSRTLRHVLRNQLVCNIAISHLVQTLVVSPAEIVNFLDLLHPPWEKAIYCHAMTVQSILGHVQSGLTDWLIFFLIAAFCVNFLRPNLAMRMSPMFVTVCKIAVHIVPWLVITSATIVSITKMTSAHKCFWIPRSTIWLYETVYTIVPTCISALVLTALYLMRQRRGGLAGALVYSNMEDEKVETMARPDKFSPYIWAMIIVLACEITNLVVLFKGKNKNAVQFNVRQSAAVLSNFRVMLGLLPYLLFPDIRNRVSTWRPWKQHTAPPQTELAEVEEMNT